MVEQILDPLRLLVLSEKKYAFILFPGHLPPSPTGAKLGHAQIYPLINKNNSLKLGDIT